jgi:hypothetical protein
VPGQSRLPQPLESFVQELALCVATNGDKGPALLWAEDTRSLPALQRLAGGGGTGEATGDVRVPAADAGTGRLAAALGRLLDLPVRPFYRLLGPRQLAGPHSGGGAERTLTVLDGACRCDLFREGGPPEPEKAREAVLDLRLRAGATLFVPRGHAYRLSDVHTPTVLLELELGEPG